MENITDSDIVKAHPEIRARMLEDEEVIRSLIKAEKDGTLIVIGDVDNK